MSSRPRSISAPNSQSATPEEALKKLGSLRLKVRTGCFDDNTLRSARKLGALLNKRNTPFGFPKDGLRARCLVCEIYDYYCRYKPAEKIVSKQAELFRGAWQEGKMEADVDLAEHQIQTVIHYADARYRLNLNDWGEVEQILKECEKRTLEIEKVAASGSGAHDRAMAISDIKARIAFSRGRVARQNGRYEDAEKHFRGCIEHLFGYVGAAAARYQNQRTRLEQELAYSNNTMAVVLSLGLSWMFVQKGQLLSARLLVTTARILFEGTTDALRKAFCQMLIGTIERSEAGRDPDKLDVAIANLQKASNSFSKLDHDRYGAIASFYLATSHFQRSQYEEAEKFARAAALARPGDLRWEVNSRIVLSRIYREKGAWAEAINFATTACNMADGGPHHDCKVDAMVALGEAQFKAGEHAKALHTFTTALSLSRQMANPKWVGACHLHVAESHIAAQRTAQAEKHLKEWHNLAPQIQNGFLQAMADDLERKIDEMSKKDFFISRDASPDELDPRKQKKRLDDWIRQQVMDRTDANSTKTAELLGVSRQTMYNNRKPKQSSKFTSQEANLEQRGKPNN
jgi:tetratricopeptide (TPR) repeat protein